MAKLSFRNLDELSAFGRLQKGAPTNTAAFLRKTLSPERVKAAELRYDLGKDGSGPSWLAYNWAAKIADDSILTGLGQLAEEADLIEKYKLVLDGEIMNPGEKRMVLHHLTRGQLGKKVSNNGNDLGEFYAKQFERIATFANAVHAGHIKATNGKPFETVVQVGIGGSDLGPRAMYIALKNYVSSTVTKDLRGRGLKLKAEFISNVDPDDAAEVLRRINPATTLFILVSKSGTTQETLTNETFVLDYLQESNVGSPRKQMICVTSETSPLAKSKDYLDSFFIDDFIGGRYSSTSAVGGAVLSLAFGPDVFAEFLDGAHHADKTALKPDLQKNPALLDALLGVYERNVLGFTATAVLPYSQALSRFPAHLQQLDMESNGKQVNRDGAPIAYHTGPTIFGEPGTNGQHSFYQELHQGTDIVPLQFVGFLESQLGQDLQFEGSSSQKKLNANLSAQIVAFALGKDDANPNKRFPGGRPSSLLYSSTLSPRVLGALLAHFENKVMFQGFLWNVNSFDQEGVQLGKVLTGKVLGGKTDGALEVYAKLLGV